MGSREGAICHQGRSLTQASRAYFASDEEEGVLRTLKPDEASMKELLLSIEKSTNNEYIFKASAKPVSPEASIRHLNGMSISSRGVAINLTVLKEPASSRAYPCLGKTFLEFGS